MCELLADGVRAVVSCAGCAQCRASHVMRCSLRECQSPLATLTLMLLVTNRFFHRDRWNSVRFLILPDSLLYVLTSVRIRCILRHR